MRFGCVVQTPIRALVSDRTFVTSAATNKIRNNFFILYDPKPLISRAAFVSAELALLCIYKLLLNCVELTFLR